MYAESILTGSWITPGWLTVLWLIAAWASGCVVQEEVEHSDRTVVVEQQEVVAELVPTPTHEEFPYEHSLQTVKPLADGRIPLVDVFEGPNGGPYAHEMRNRGFTFSK